MKKWLFPALGCLACALGLAAAAVLAVCAGTALGGYLAWATRNDFLWLDLAQLPHKDASIIYA